MENSFYYFFSATPQVLGGILALFGVFVLFKLQSLTIELISIGKEIQHYLAHYSNKSESTESLDNRVNSLPEIGRAILTKKIKDLQQSLNKITEFKASPFLEAKYRFDTLYLIYSDLIKRTIFSSLFTGMAIIVCLAIIPFGKWIICYPYLLFFSYFILIICVAYIFYNLFLILRNAIQ
jgi:hypothetical protein